MPRIPTYRPQFSVTLIKRIKRSNGISTRYAAADGPIDLTPYFGEGNTITTSKGVDRAEGHWQFTVGDQVDRPTQDSLYALIEPMDIIEIRGSRNAYLYAGEKLPLLMRGFVSTVGRSESMGGQPQRSVSVSGEDWGKLWNIHGVWMELALSQEKPLLTTYQLQAILEIYPQILKVGDFMQVMIDKVINQKMKDMAGFYPQPGKGGASYLPSFTLAASVKSGLVCPQAVGVFPPGPFWSIVKNFSDEPWNELWIDDSDETGPQLVFRPTPYKDADGNWIGDATAPDVIEITQADVQAIDVARGDGRVANFFWVPPGATLVETPNLIAAYDIAAGAPLDLDYPNNTPELYGFRKMECSSKLLPDELSTHPMTQSPDEQTQSAQDYKSWHTLRANLLRDMNRDAVVFEDGNMTLMGNEGFRPGMYLRFVRGQITSTFYMPAVSHTIQPFNTWTSSVTLERGDGFIQRNKADSPYWQEGRPGVFG